MSLLSRVVPAALAAAALVAPTTAHAAPLYAGTVVQGETDTYTFDNHPKGDAQCIQLATTYQVTVNWAPTSDTLTLTAGGKTVTASGGSASVSFLSGVCTAFGIAVTGTAVADTAAYVVNVRSGPLTELGKILAWG